MQFSTSNCKGMLLKTKNADHICKTEPCILGNEDHVWDLKVRVDKQVIEKELQELKL